MTPVRQLWLDIALVAVALAPLAWMGRQWLKEWRAHRAGTLLPRGYRPPEPPTLRQPWRWRFLWLYAAQAAAIGGLMWLSIGEPCRNGEQVPFAMIPLGFAVWTVLVAFATAVLTRLWDRAPGLARRRGTASEGEQAPGKQVGIPATRGRLHQGP